MLVVRNKLKSTAISVTQCMQIYFSNFTSLTRRPDFLQSEAYLSHVYMSSWGETTSVWTWIMRCQSSTTCWQPCTKSYIYINNKMDHRNYISDLEISITYLRNACDLTCLYYVVHLDCSEKICACIRSLKMHLGLKE